jgi:Transglycosylase SLT domain
MLRTLIAIKCIVAIVLLTTANSAYSRPSHEGSDDCHLNGHRIYVATGLNYPRAQWASWGIICRTPKLAEGVGRTAPSDRPTVNSNSICRAVEKSATENELPVPFFARVIWQESRFNARAVSPKGAEGIAQFMSRAAVFRGLNDPFDPIAALHKAASYLADLRSMFGNLGLAAAGYNAGPGRVSAWLHGKGALPDETRNYIKAVTGLTADDWTSSKPLKMSGTAVPRGVPCVRLVNLVRSAANN